MQRADLLLALDEQLDVDRQVVAQRAQGGEVDGDAGLVVGGAPAEQASAALDRLEGVRRPLREVAGRLHIVVGVEQDGGPLVAGVALPQDGGVRALDLEQAHVAEARISHELGGGQRRATHVRGIEAPGADRGDADEALQLRPRAGEAGGDAGAKVVVHGDSGAGVRSDRPAGGRAAAAV